MQFTLTRNIVPPFIEYDILLAGGIKIKEHYYYIQYFDFSHSLTVSGSTSWRFPRQYSPLFFHLQQFAQKKTSLRAQCASLALRMYNNTCSLSFSAIQQDTCYPRQLFATNISIEEWFVIEELLINQGLEITGKHKYHRRSYSLPRHDTTLLLLVQNDTATLSLEAPGKKQIREVLALLGLGHRDSDLSTE